MKKRLLILILLITIVVIVDCIQKISDKSISYKKKELLEQINQTIEKSNESLDISLGPGGCRSHQECKQYCQQSQVECQNWCNKNPELCNKMLGEEAQGQFPSGFPGEEFPSGPPEGMSIDEMMKMMTTVGPGGCRGPNCQQYCQQNFQECQNWCLENPDEAFCDLFFGFGERMGETIGEVAEPPKTIITYAKSLNFNAGQFTQNDILKAKQLGANMVTFWPIRMVRNDEISTFTMADLPQMIDFAHKNGLQVELRSSIIFPETAKNYEKYKANAIKHAAEYAKLAEKYKVYRIVPFAEVDNDLMNHCSKITEFTLEVLAEMRKHYSGKIGTGIAAPWRDCGFTFKGYEYLTVSAYPHKDLATSINWAKEVADKSGIKILHIGETGVFNPEDPETPDKFQTLELSKDKEADYYRDLFTQFSDKVDGFSIFYNSGKVPMSINGDPAEEVVKEWYNKLGLGVEEKIQEDTTKLIVANPIDLLQITRISKFRSCAGHDYSGLNINLEKEPISSMKHYVEFSRQFLGSKDTVKIFAPFDGKITEVIEAGGKQIFISANKDPKWHFIFFHTSPLTNIQVGATVKAGQLIGYAYVSEWPTFDIAFKKFSFKGEIFDSPFMYMPNGVIKEYELRGVNIKNIIIPKQFRENNPCPIRGTMDGEEAFTGETEKDDFVILK